MYTYTYIFWFSYLDANIIRRLLHGDRKDPRVRFDLRDHADESVEAPTPVAQRDASLSEARCKFIQQVADEEQN